MPKHENVNRPAQRLVPEPRRVVDVPLPGLLEGPVEPAWERLWEPTQEPTQEPTREPTRGPARERVGSDD